MDWDVFISHAWEDKDSFARPLAEALQAKGLKVWFDEFTLTIGDSLRRSIDHGLANSRYGIVILSPNFFVKEWPQKELDGLVSREISGVKVILPIWHNITADQIRKYSPTLADKVAVTSNRELGNVVAELLCVIEGSTSEKVIPEEPKAVPSLFKRLNLRRLKWWEVITFIVALLSCIAAWLTLPQIQGLLTDNTDGVVLSPTSTPSATSTESPTSTPSTIPTETLQSTTAPPTKTPTIIPQPTAATTTQILTETSTPVYESTTSSVSSCPAWFATPVPGKAVLLLENHYYHEVKVSYYHVVETKMGFWSRYDEHKDFLVPAKQSDESGRGVLQTSPGSLHLIIDSLNGVQPTFQFWIWNETDPNAFQFQAGQVLGFPLFDFSAAGEPEPVPYPLEIPSGCPYP